MMLQTGIVSQFPLLRGTADLILLAVIAWALQKRVQSAWQWSIIAGLLVTIVSALPAGVPIIMYPLAVGMALILRQRVWQVPILAMFIATFFGTLLTQAVAYLSLRLVGHPIPWLEAMNLITLPSVILNLLLAIPIYAILSDLANWLYPEEIEV